MTKAIIIDPALKGEAGHHLSLSTELSKAAHAMGHEPVWLGHKDLEALHVPAFARFIPAFSSSIYERQIGISGRILRPVVGNRRYLRSTFAEADWEIRLRHKFRLPILNGDRSKELALALDREGPGSEDHLIIHSADPQTVDMLSGWASVQARDSLPKIHVRTCWSEANMPFPRYAGGFAQAIRRLSSVSRSVTLSCETLAGATQLARNTGLAVNVCPHLLSAETLQLSAPGKSSDALIVGWLGEPRPEKGVWLLADIIRGVLASEPKRPVRFLLQAGGRTSRKARNLFAQLEEFGDAVELLVVAVSQRDYLSALSRCNILLLPYDPTAYPPERGSGAALEALLTGRPMVATANTFAAGLIEADSGVIGKDVAELAQGILTIAANYDGYLAGAMRAQERARKMYDRENCYRSLIGFGDDDRAAVPLLRDTATG